MAATITTTPNATMETNHSLAQAFAKGLKMEIGTITTTAETYTTGGDPMTINMPNPKFVLIPPSGGYEFVYTVSTGYLALYYCDYNGSDGPMIEFAGATWPVFTAIPYFAIGF